MQLYIKICYVLHHYQLDVYVLHACFVAEAAFASNKLNYH